MEELKGKFNGLEVENYEELSEKLELLKIFHEKFEGFIKRIKELEVENEDYKQKISNFAI